MISALTCKINALNEIDEYCTKNIQPLLLSRINQPIYYGKYTIDGNNECYISYTYANKPPCVKSFHLSNIHPFDIKTYLESLGYLVEWVKVREPYPAGYSSSKKTKYYSEGYNSYYSLKITP